MKGGVPLPLNWSMLWSKVLADHADQTALILFNGTISFQQLDQEVQALADALQSKAGQMNGSIVAVSAEKANFLRAFITLWSLDCTVIPYSPKMLRQEPTLERLIDSVANFWLDSNNVLSERTSGGDESYQGGHVEFHRAPHAIYFTSGTSGKSKGVLRAWSQAIFEAGHYAFITKMEPGHFNAMLIDPTFGASTKQILASLLMGCAQGFPHLEHGPEEVSEGHILYGTPSHFRGGSVHRVSQNAKFDWVSLTGESPSAKALDCASKYLLPNGRILNAYGGTEFGVASNQIIEPVVLEIENADSDSSLFAHKHSLILDDHGEPLPRGRLGRLVMESKYLAEGYFAIDEHEALSFTSFPILSDGRRRFVTDDIASLDRFGGIQYHGRSNRMMKLQGQWVDTSPLQSLLENSRLVNDFILDHDALNGELRVWVVPVAGIDGPVLRETLMGLDQELIERFAVFKSLNYFKVDEIPRNRNGKVDYQSLSSMSYEPIKAGSISFFEEILDYLLHGVFPSYEDLIQKSLSALGMTSIELLDLANQFARARQIPLDVSLFLADKSLISLRESLMEKHSPKQWPLHLGNGNRSYCLLWFGFGGISDVRRIFGSEHEILYWDCDWSLISNYALQDANIENLVNDQLKPVLDFLRDADSILIGGFSFGALMTHETGHQLEKQGIPVEQLVLLDPPFQGGLKTNRYFRFLANRLSTVLKTLLGYNRFSERSRQNLRKSFRRTVISRFKANPVRVPSFIQTTQKRRVKTGRLLAGACLNPDWVHEPTHKHFEILSEPRYKNRWLKVIEGWSRRGKAFEKQHY